MADEKMIQAKQVYETICKALDAEKWNYKKIEEKLQIEAGARGEDLPIEIAINVDAERQLVLLISHLPFVVPEDKRLDIAVAVGVVNNVIVDGHLDYDVATGHLFFRMTNSYIDSLLHPNVFLYLVYCACQTVDDFNDKLFMLGKGVINLEQFIKDYTKE